MSHSDYCLFLNAWYWRFERAGFTHTAAAIAEIDNPPKYDPQNSADALADGWN